MSKYEFFNICYKNAKGGDDEYKKILLNELKPLILKSIKLYYNSYIDFDDLIQEGYVIALETLSDEKIDGGKHFLGYFKNALRYHYLKKHRGYEELSLDKEFASGEPSFKDILVDESMQCEELVVEKETRGHLLNSLSTLTDREVEIVYRYYMQDMNMKEIAILLEISYRTVVNIKTKAIVKLRKSFKTYEKK